MNTFEANLEYDYRRMGKALCAAATVTLVLLCLMHLLIVMDESEIIDTPPIRLMSPIMETPVIDENPTKPKDERPVIEDEPPRPVTPQNIEIPDFTGVEGGITVIDPVRHEVGISNDVSQPIPIVKIAAEYPPRALRMGAEGYVDLSFTVTATGGVSDVEVIAANPRSLFNKAAIRAVKKWKYQPKVIDGQAVSQQGVMTRVVFELKK